MTLLLPHDGFDSKHTLSDPLEPVSVHVYQPSSISSFSVTFQYSAFAADADLRSKSPNLASTLPVPLLGICIQLSRCRTIQVVEVWIETRLHEHGAVAQRHCELISLAAELCTQRSLGIIGCLEFLETMKHRGCLEERDRGAYLVEHGYRRAPHLYQGA